MKKSMKKFIAPLLAAVAFGTISVGTTFALFTDKADTTIEIAAGIVNVDTDVSIDSVTSLYPEDEHTQKISANEAVFENGGSVTITTNESGQKVVNVSKFTPGDKVVLNVVTKNKSNVNIKSRMVETHTSSTSTDLYEALDISYLAKDKNNNDITYKLQEWSYYEAATDEEGYTLVNVKATIEFVDHDDKAIVYDVQNKDNKYQNAQCSIVFTQEAVQGNAHVLNSVQAMNEALDASTKKNPTMYDALKEVNVTARAAFNKDYVWDSQEDHFYFRQDVTASERYFRVYEAMPSSQDFSIYALDWSNPGSINLNAVGFDAGDVTGFTAINYSNTTSTAKTVIIRSNDGELNVNAPLDTVNHYNYANLLTVYAIAGNSYHEYGSVGQAELQAGRLVVEEGGYIGKLTDSGEGEKEIVINGLVLDVDTTTTATGDGTYGDQVNEDESIIKVYDFEQFQSLANMCNEGTTFKGLTIQLQNDIDFANKVWTPFGRYAYRDSWSNKDIIVLRDSRFFMGTLDGNGHKILNFSNKGYVAPSFDELYPLETDNPVKADVNYGLIAMATGDVTVKNLKVNYAFEEVAAQQFEGAALIGQYLPMEIEPIAKVQWNGSSWSDPIYNDRIDTEHMTYELKTSTVTFSNVETSGNIIGYDGIGAYIGTNYGSRHPQTVNEMGVYEWRSYKWYTQNHDEQFNADPGKLAVEEFAKANGGHWYAYPFNVRVGTAQRPRDLTLTINGEPVSTGSSNCMGYAPLRTTYVFDHCTNSANSTATATRSGIFFGKLSNIGSLPAENFINVNITNSVNTGDVRSPSQAGIIAGSGSADSTIIITYNSGLNNGGKAYDGDNVYEGDAALFKTH